MSINFPILQDGSRLSIDAEEFIKIWKGDYLDNESYSSYYRKEEHNIQVGFTNVDIRGSVIIANLDIKHELSFFNVRCDHIEFINVRVNGAIFITANTTIESIEISSKSALGFIFIQSSKIDLIKVDSSYGGNLKIDKSVIGKIFLFNDSLFSEINAHNTVLEEIQLLKSNTRSIILSKLNRNSSGLYIKGGEVDILSLDLNNAYHTIIEKYEGKRSSIQKIYLTSAAFASSVYFQISDTNVQDLYINSFINNGIIIFNNVAAKKTLNTTTTLQIVNSDLGNLQFIGCDLTGFGKFEYKNSKMASVFLADTILPHRSAITTSYDADLKEQLRLALSQFKKIYEGQGDIVRAAEYRAEEMEVYRSQLSKRNKLGTWLILSLSHFTSSYGQSIWRPIFWLFCGHYLFFMWALGEEAFGKCTFQEIIYSFFYLMNPIHQYIFKNDWTILIDACMRIWSSYMVYNFIRASRRFIK